MAEKKESVYRKPKYFQFNLLSEQSEEEIQRLEERDDSTLYAMVLVFSGIFIYFILNLIQIIIVQGRINLIQSRIDETVAAITAYNDIRALNGEIFQKANLLRDPLLSDIELDRLLEISSLMTQDEGEILTYSRNQSGEFELVVDVENEEMAVRILENADELDDVTRSYIKQMSHENEQNSIRVTYGFDIIYEIENQV